ncbi:MAG: hypothetical protein R2855_01510 [Thermomicrobiales bacterium]
MGASEFAAMPKNSIVIAVSALGNHRRTCSGGGVGVGAWGAGLDVNEVNRFRQTVHSGTYAECGDESSAGSSWQRNAAASRFWWKTRRLQDGVELINVVDKRAG